MNDTMIYRRFITAHSELNLTDTQLAFIKRLYKWNYRLNTDQMVDEFVRVCMEFCIEPMDMLKLAVLFEYGFSASVRESNYDY